MSDDDRSSGPVRRGVPRASRDHPRARHDAPGRYCRLHSWHGRRHGPGDWSSVPAFGLFPCSSSSPDSRSCSRLTSASSASAGISRCTTRARTDCRLGAPRDAIRRARGRRQRHRPALRGVFVIATLLNLIPVGHERRRGPMLAGGVPLELAVFGMLHLVFIGRVFQARGSRRASARAISSCSKDQDRGRGAAFSRSRIQSFGVTNPSLR